MDDKENENTVEYHLYLSANNMQHNLSKKLHHTLAGARDT